ncbi:LysR family transcriptional regulator [Brevibacterium senegalense]|uniref:LysR family transcriptional regulator n=2 Tax=Brevibacterium senegalense TaxID=1033736 RepID=UPI0002E07D07|nr:LysR family transcriptional regulator [Brevibacterium senegalense]
MSQMSLKRLSYFVALADTLHFGGAAEAMGVSQPALSGEIKKLEEELGIMLFTRKPRPALTREGKALVNRARTLMAAVERFEVEAQQLSQGVQGSVTIGCVPSFFLRGLLDVVAAFEETWPGIAIHLVELNTTTQMEQLSVGAIDIACSHAPGQGSELRRVRVANEELRLCAAPDKLVRSLADARDLPFVTVRRDVSPDYWEKAVTVCGIADFVPQVRYETMTWAAVVSLVRSGLGYSLLPAIIADQNPDLVAAAHVSDDVRSRSWIVMRESDSTSAVGQVFDSLHDAFGGQ